jgi:hypothetical protein
LLYNKDMSNDETNTPNNSPNSTPLTTIQSSQALLDDYKDNIPENLYLQLSNLNSTIYKENSNNYYRVTYSDFKVIQPAPDIYLIRPVIKNEILTLTDEMFRIYTNLKNKSMREKGYYLPTSHNLLGLDLKRLNTNPFVHVYSGCCKKNIECDCDESFCEAPETHQISLDYEPQIIKIIKL